MYQLFGENLHLAVEISTFKFYNKIITFNKFLFSDKRNGDEKNYNVLIGIRFQL